MKKLMWMVCLLVVSVTAQAQFEKGKWIVNPSVTGLGLSYSKSGRKYSSDCRRKAEPFWWTMWR